jgi:hypothetical protein
MDGNSFIQGIKTLRRAEAHESLTNDEIMIASVTAGYLRGFLDSSIRWSEVDQNSLFKLPERGIPLPQFVQATTGASDIRLTQGHGSTIQSHILDPFDAYPLNLEGILNLPPSGWWYEPPKTPATE